MPIWNNVTTLQRIQFPFRLLSLIGVAAAVIAAAGAYRIKHGTSRGARALAVALYRFAGNHNC
ncbi:MAG TPA: hypothetical protein DEA22_07965, partial [Blastocatellia bacterium]|nr:hypothetical protein [Blastocatellia bacterium]